MGVAEAMMVLETSDLLRDQDDKDIDEIARIEVPKLNSWIEARALTNVNGEIVLRICA